MKKWISLFLAMLMIGVCAAGIAEGTEETGTTAFLRIKEGVTAQVYEKPGDAQAVDSLAGGKLCGLIDTVTTESGDVWYQVFYLNSKGAGTPGYIKAEDAEQLTDEELKKLMEDPAVLNEVLDLVDALDAYLNGKTGNTGSGNAQPEDQFKALYEKAMNELQKLFNTSVSSELDNLGKQGKELADQAKAAGEKLVDEAKKAGEDLKNDVTDALKAMDGKNTNDAIDSLMDSISEAVEKRTGQSDQNLQDTLDKMAKSLKDLNDKVGQGAGNASNGFNQILDDAKNFLNSQEFTKVQNAMSDLGKDFKDGMTNGANSLNKLVDTLKDAFSTNNP